MIKQLFVFFAIALAFVSASNLPADAVLLQGPSGQKWVALGAMKPFNRVDAGRACIAIGGRLAPISEGPDFRYLARNVQMTSWIFSWNGDNYNNNIAFYPGGAIAVPNGGVDALGGALCAI